MEDSDKKLQQLADSQAEGSMEENVEDIKQRLEKIEANLGVDKIVLTDLGEKIQVTVQTPLGSVVCQLNHTPNTVKLSRPHERERLESDVGSNLAMASMMTGAMKGGPAGMTPDQLQDFKKQTLQINALQQRIKDLETRLADANNLIKKGEEYTTDLKNKELEDVKEILLYLDSINTTMSEKIANQRVEMEKLAGDTPQPINYDPFNYGEAYSGDVVDFEARKRIGEVKLLLLSLQTGMAQLKDSLRISPTIDLGYKVVRLDELVQATGFGPAILSGELTHEHGLLMTQSNNMDSTEKRYPRMETFQTDVEKASSWNITDSIMQTMYRIEAELGQLQKTVVNLDALEFHREAEDQATSPKTNKSSREMEEAEVKALVEKECNYMFKSQDFHRVTIKEESHKTSAPINYSDGGDIAVQFATMQKSMYILKTKVAILQKKMKPGSSVDHAHGKKRSYEFTHRKSVPEAYQVRHGAATNLTQQPVKLRYLLQRVFGYQVPDNRYASQLIPCPIGRGYPNKWPHLKKDAAPFKEYVEDIIKVAHPMTDECTVVGKDGRIYRGDKAPARPLVKP